MRHMVNRFIPPKEKELLRTIFDALDEEKDGELTSEEFCTQFKEKFNLELGVKAMNEMISYLDSAEGGDNLIQFTEFLVAACDKNIICTDENIRKEFNFIDEDLSGIIGTDEIITFMDNMTDVNKKDTEERRSLIK